MNDVNYTDHEILNLLNNADDISVNDQSRGRVNPVQRQLQREQPQTSPIQRNNWTPNMPSNGGYKKKRTNKNSKKYKNKNYKNKYRKRQQTKRFRKMK
jgi:hypothetical protein